MSERTLRILDNDAILNVTIKIMPNVYQFSQYLLNPKIIN